MILANDCGALTMTDDSQSDGETPGEDISGLILTHLSTPAARNAAEAEAIGRAYDKYAFRARRKKQETGFASNNPGHEKGG